MVREKIKSITLITLIVTSILQVGILWDYQDRGFPFNFLSAISAMSSGIGAGGVEKLKQDVFEPNRIIVSAGLDEPHWILNKGTENQSEYNELWKEGIFYLKSILNSENIQSFSSNNSKDSIKDWEDLAVKKGVIYEFKTVLPPSLLSFFLDTTQEPAGDINGMYKMLISPWDDINYNSFAVYIYDGNSKLNKYIISSANSSMKKDKYDAMVEKFYKLTESDALRSYGVIKETRNTFQYPARQDMPIIKNGSKFEPFQVLNLTIPEPFSPKAGEKTNEIEKKFDAILGSGKDSYDISSDSLGTVAVKNLNNIYKIYPDGVMEYRNLSNVTTYSEKFDHSKALKTALDFIDKMKLLPANVDVYLSGLQEQSDKIKLTFDYQLSGVPVIIDYSVPGRDSIKNAITIEVNSKRVVSCWWVIRNFEQINEKRQYAANFVDVMDNIFKQYPFLKSDKGLVLKDAYVAYNVSYNNEVRLEPSWFIYTENDSYYSVKMASKKGD